MGLGELIVQINTLQEVNVLLEQTTPVKGDKGDSPDMTDYYTKEETEGYFSENSHTHSNLTALDNVSGTNTGNETTSTVGALINNATEKTTPADADMVGVMDSAGTNVLKKLSWANIKATLKSYFDTLYASISNTPTVTYGSSAPTSTPSKVGDIYINTTNVKTYVAKGTFSSADWILQADNLLHQVRITNLLNPADNTTYYFGYQGSGNTADGRQRVYLGTKCSLKSVSIFGWIGVGSSEAASLYIRVNNTTDYLISDNVLMNAQAFVLSVSGLSVPLASTDYFEYKLVCPAYATNPTSVSFGLNSKFEINE